MKFKSSKLFSSTTKKVDKKFSEKNIKTETITIFPVQKMLFNF